MTTTSQTRQRITIFVLHDHDDADYVWVLDWLERWGELVTVADYSTGGWEHLWDVEAPATAVAEVPADWLCSSEWATPELFVRPTFWQRLRALFKASGKAHS